MTPTTKRQPFVLVVVVSLSWVLLGCSVPFLMTANAFAPRPANHVLTKSSLQLTNDPSSSTPKECVFKFGGSSLANADRIDHVTNIIKEQLRNENCRPRAVVCSAMGKTTNLLMKAGQDAFHGNVDLRAVRTLYESTLREFHLQGTHTETEVTQILDDCQRLLQGIALLEELSPCSLDHLVSTGERCAVRIVAARLNQIGVPAEAYDAWQVGMFTDDHHQNAGLVRNYKENIGKAFQRIDANVVAVVTGFLGMDRTTGKITTLGRGGSDLTATAIGAGLNVDEIQVWKDVDGILTTDPNVVSDAKTVPVITYEEASELAQFGAQVLHPIAMQPAKTYNIPVRVKNSYNPSAVGSRIQLAKEDKDESLVTAITFKRDVAVLDLHSTEMVGTFGFLSYIFQAFERHQLSVDVLASSEVSVSLTLDKNQEDAACIECLLGELNEKGGIEVTQKNDMSILTLIANVERSSEVLAQVFETFHHNGIEVSMMSQGASKVNISFAIHTRDLERAVLYLHGCFFGTLGAYDKNHNVDLLEEEIRENIFPTIDVTASGNESGTVVNATTTTTIKEIR